MSRIESGKSGIRQLDLKALLDLYEVKDPGARESWLALARESRRQRWWRVLEDQLPQDFLDLVGLEDEVSECRGFQPGIVPGLFQTEAYATAVIQGGVAGPLNTDQQTKVRVRMERQKALTREAPSPLRVWMILGEAALRQQVGGPTVLHEQLLHLVRVARLPNVTLQVLPFTAGACPGGPYPFLIYGFPPPAELEVALLENFASHAYLESREDTVQLGSAFDHLRASALSALDSEVRIIQIAEELTDP